MSVDLQVKFLGDLFAHRQTGDSGSNIQPNRRFDRHRMLLVVSNKSAESKMERKNQVKGNTQFCMVYVGNVCSPDGRRCCVKYSSRLILRAAENAK